MIVYFITFDDALDLHDQLIDKFGGLAGIRDHKLLESALAQAQSTAFGQYLHSNVYAMAAAYCFHIIKNHAFLDGNKRTGLLVTITFLEKNGLVLNVEFESLYALAIDVATSKMSKQDLAEFFRKNTIKEL